MKAYILYIEKGDSKKYALDTLASCLKHGLDAELYEGVHSLLNDDITRIYGYTMGRPGTFDNDRQYHREFCCSLGHMAIWMKIAQDNEPAIVLEHDAVVVAPLDDVRVEDNQILWLGPRVWNRDDYSYPEGVAQSYTKVERFEGTHAYAVTPMTARKMLGNIFYTNHILMNVDGLMGVNNMFKMNLVALDPPRVVAEVGDRDTYAQAPEKGNAQSNWENLPGFLKGLRAGVKPFETTSKPTAKSNQVFSYKIG